ncbi:hypothetical protein HNR67_004948 [Crossiella cryophila]|uniref:Uncharacterized protein n=1 Tax=Crossiella cryophila TaxID=43355 RepID=A0A7W7FVA3_9PSEU|nr:hypothetical protein [Crossiella cryophila]
MSNEDELCQRTDRSARGLGQVVVPGCCQAVELLFFAVFGMSGEMG